MWSRTRQVFWRVNGVNWTPRRSSDRKMASEKIPDSNILNFLPQTPQVFSQTINPPGKGETQGKRGDCCESESELIVSGRKFFFKYCSNVQKTPTITYITTEIGIHIHQQPEQCLCTHALYCCSELWGQRGRGFAEPGCSTGQLSEPSTGGE